MTTSAAYNYRRIDRIAFERVRQQSGTRLRFIDKQYFATICDQKESTTREVAPDELHKPQRFPLKDGLFRFGTFVGEIESGKIFPENATGKRYFTARDVGKNVRKRIRRVYEEIDCKGRYDPARSHFAEFISYVIVFIVTTARYRPIETHKYIC